MKIYPKCHPYWIVDEKKVNNNDPRGVTYSSRGYLLPCCWSDNIREDYVKDFEFFGFYEDELKLENIENVDDIILSDEWKEFHRILLQEPHHAPKLCKKKCGILVKEDLIVKG